MGLRGTPRSGSTADGSWGYERDLLEPGSVHRLIELVKGTSRDGFRFLIPTRFTGGTIPADNVLATADFALLHGMGYPTRGAFGRW